VRYYYYGSYLLLFFKCLTYVSSLLQQQKQQQLGRSRSSDGVARPATDIFVTLPKREFAKAAEKKIMYMCKQRGN